MPTLRILAEEGVTGTILAPWQADTPRLDARRPYRVDVGAGRHVAVAFYDGGLSGAISFEPSVTADADRFARERIAPRLAGTLPDGTPPMLIIASDGELYGHHQAFRDLFLQRLVAPSADTPDRGYDVVTLSEVLAEVPGHPHPEIRIHERTSWSCHHGVLRWSGECPDARTGAGRVPLRAALERLAGGIDTIDGDRGARTSPAWTTSGGPGTATWTWSSGSPPPTRSRRRSLARSDHAARRTGCSG